MKKNNKKVLLKILDDIDNKIINTPNDITLKLYGIFIDNLIKNLENEK